MKASDLNGRAIVTLSDAAKVGQVDDVLFDAEYRRVLGLRVKKGLFDKAQAVSRESVTAVGADAVTVPSPDVVNVEERFAELSGATPLSRARGTKVITEGGELVGTIDELELDDNATSVISYTLSAPLWDRMRGREPRITAAEVLRLGDGGIMIVSNAVGTSLRGESGRTTDKRDDTTPHEATDS